MSETTAPEVAPETDDSPYTQEQLLEVLKSVKDPELHVNIVALGLVYAVGTRGTEVDVDMTLTSPACPAGPQLLRDATAALESMPSITKANVKLVMDPPWSVDRMTDEARDELGIF